MTRESGAMCFVHDAQTPLQVEAMVVDETSMVDLTLMQSLLLALPPRCRLVLVGDPDQLPSVGPGNVFSDLIRSGVIPTVRLTEIFRQAQKSLIVMNAHAINHGQLPELRAKDRDFFFLKRRTAAEVTETIQELCAKRLPKNMGIAPAEIQVLSPTRKGGVAAPRISTNCFRRCSTRRLPERRRKSTEIFPSARATE